ncbi:MAG: sulfurtransferase [candidate division Zixibacteria bacterium]|nr:sulfurtransferase [candidate division Zixibacteria bacterium]
MSSRRHLNKLYVVLLAVILAACQGQSGSQTEHVAPDTMGTLVSTEWLSEHLNDPDLVVLDCTVRMEMDASGGMRSVSGRSDYEDGHIPTAGFADLKGELRDGDSPLEFGMPTPEEFCAAMGALGVGDNSRVVLYDNFNSVWASRVWWMLRWAGFDRAALLDGGMKAWTAEDRPLSTEPAPYQARQLTPHQRPELIAYHDEVFAALDNDAVCLVDAMPEAHFNGEMALYGCPGHIPGAINVPATALIDESGRYRSEEELAALCEDDHNARVITYCGGGIAASSNAFVMHRLGYTDVAVYMASLQEWAADSANPLAVGRP